MYEIKKVKEHYKLIDYLAIREFVYSIVSDTGKKPASKNS